MTILRVAILCPLRRIFDYLPSPDQENLIFEVGARLLVPFRNQKKIGVIVEITDKSDFPIEKLKSAYRLLDETSLLPHAILELIRWASRYYQSPLGEVFECALPLRLRKEEPKSTKQSKAPNIQDQKKTIASPYTLNIYQEQAIAAIKQKLATFKVFVLDGVTGSGKTEVYIQTIEHVIQKGLQALILVPEIGLTPQLLSRLEDRFNCPIIALNSSLTEKQRYLAWEKARVGDAPIVVGTRSAAFVPLKNPGVFIIDEEHDASFKQQEGFRYHARDLIILRASLENCPVVLGTATPSLETLQNMNNGRYQSLQLPTRAGNAKPPMLQILDIRHKKLEEGLCAQLLKIMRDHIENQGQVLLFLNRRGFAPVLMCCECGWIATCKHCDAKMTYHLQSQKLQCHHCELTLSVVTQCPACSHKELKPIGIGTERLEAFLSDYFPNISIARIDKDTTRKKGALKEKIDEIAKGNARILLGTQMIAKGHHFPDVTLVAILDIDHALYSNDFRATEKMGQLITQVAGRAGRAEKLGQVLLQTSHPENPLLKKLLEEGYHNFANTLLSERRTANLPPFSFQALIRADANKLERALNFLQFAKRQANQNPNISVLGPAPAPMERRQGRFRAQLLLQSDQRKNLQNVLKQLIPTLESEPSAMNVRWSLDVDPIDLY